jgi:hypothetical protein
MPILATILPPGEGEPGGPGVPVPVPLDDRRLEFRSLNGTDTIEWTGSEWIIQSGIQGLDVPPRDLVTEQVPGMDGARLREIRTGARTVVLPFFVYGDDGVGLTHRAQLARLRRFIDYRDRDYAGAEGTFDLVAVGLGGERLLRCTYVDGMEGVAGISSGSGPHWSTFDAKLLAVQPYWRGQQWSTPTVVTGTGASAFLSNSLLFPRQISGSVALGENMHVNVGGDVPSPPMIELDGPFSTVTITSPQGLNISVGAVASGRLLIETGRRRRVTLDGVPAWQLVGDSPRWQPLPPGEATISIVATGATSSTAARVFGTSLWETAW